MTLAVNHQFTLIAPDRPGTGLSTFQPNRKIPDWPTDVLSLVSHLSIPTFHVIAGSGGSPYALACTKTLPASRLLSTTIISGIYPLSLGTTGMLLRIKAVLYAMTYLPTFLLQRLLEWEFPTTETPEEFEAKFMSVMEKRSVRDRQCLDDEAFRRCMVGSMREAFRGGSLGPAYEAGLFGEWGFGVEEVVGKKVVLWHGRGDVNVPVGMAERAAEKMECRLRIVEGETHLSLPYYHIEEIIREVLGKENGDGRSFGV
ncbi:alpha/beta-hydrolase [Mollisia scopiformis]|uniref:Alpha/beta-hydrolase n=1 Tax=Mollisia scopiformis TaxID=149040 RepID=A0A194XT11_MOLSC|nr:alpha/beta-hydrolase [Mollisia scopiformis]KUJ23440.1 alpha/beta-hydrolase [Mollisia scopiformis]